MLIERHADGPKAGVWTLGIICVGEDVGVRGVACGGSEGDAVGEGDEGDFVADGLGPVPDSVSWTGVLENETSGLRGGRPTSFRER